MKCFVCGAEVDNGQICPNCGCDNSKMKKNRRK